MSKYSIFNEEDFQDLNKSLKVRPMFTVMSKEEEDSVRVLSGRGGSTHRYPWDRIPVGRSFFKEVPKKDLDADKGRPALTPNLKRLGLKWTTRRIYNGYLNQYGYQCTRVS